MHNWGERQYETDTSTPRVQQFRERQRAVRDGSLHETLHETYETEKCNEHETTPDTDTDTDTEQIQSRAEQSGDGSRTRSPSTTGTRLPNPFPLTDEMGIYANQHGFVTLAEVVAVHEDFCEYWWAKAGAAARKVDWQLTFKRWVREDARKRGERAARAGPGNGHHPNLDADMAAWLQVVKTRSTRRSTGPCRIRRRRERFTTQSRPSVAGARLTRRTATSDGTSSRHTRRHGRRR